MLGEIPSFFMAEGYCTARWEFYPSKCMLSAGWSEREETGESVSHQAARADTKEEFYVFNFYKSS